MRFFNEFDLSQVGQSQSQCFLAWRQRTGSAVLDVSEGGNRPDGPQAVTPPSRKRLGHTGNQLWQLLPACCRHGGKRSYGKLTVNWRHTFPVHRLLRPVFPIWSDVITEVFPVSRVVGGVVSGQPILKSNICIRKSAKSVEFVATCHRPFRPQPWFLTRIYILPTGIFQESLVFLAITVFAQCHQRMFVTDRRTDGRTALPYQGQGNVRQKWWFIELLKLTANAHTVTIAVTCTICKNMEVIIKDELLNYLLCNSLISKHQTVF